MAEKYNKNKEEEEHSNNVDKLFKRKYSSAFAIICSALRLNRLLGSSEENPKEFKSQENPKKQGRHNISLENSESIPEKYMGSNDPYSEDSVKKPGLGIALDVPVSLGKDSEAIGKIVPNIRLHTSKKLDSKSLHRDTSNFKSKYIKGDISHLLGDLQPKITYQGISDNNKAMYFTVQYKFGAKPDRRTGKYNPEDIEKITVSSHRPRDESNMFEIGFEVPLHHKVEFERSERKGRVYTNVPELKAEFGFDKIKREKEYNYLKNKPITDDNKE